MPKWYSKESNGLESDTFKGVAGGPITLSLIPVFSFFFFFKKKKKKFLYFFFFIFFFFIK